jgi:flavin-dependent dehydrogenase
LISGELAALTIGEAFDVGRFESPELVRYEKAWKGVFGKELRVGYYARLMFESLNDKQVESLLEEFLSEKMLNEVLNAPDFSFDWHSTIIIKVLRHTNMRKIIRSFGPAVAPFAARLLRARA